MTNGEEQIVKSILQDFIEDSVPEYILETARGIVNEDGVQKMDLKRGTSTGTLMDKCKVTNSRITHLKSA